MPPARPPSNPVPVRRRRDTARGLLLPAVVASAFIHFIALMTVRFDVPVEPERARVRPIPMVRIAPAMQAYELELVASDVAPIEVQVLQQTESQPIAPVVVPPPPGGGMAATPRPGVAAPDPFAPIRERLRYRVGSAEAWRAPQRVPAELLRPDAPLNADVAIALAAYNDSVAAAAAAAERAVDWTKRDADGGRWGVSPGKIHLGDITLPLPVAFAPPPGRRDEINGRMQQWQETRIQTARAEGEEVTRDRIRAIRARVDAERARRLAADSAAATAPADLPPPAPGR